MNFIALSLEIITPELFDKYFWPGIFEAMLMVVKQPIFILLVILVIAYNILKANLRKKKNKAKKISRSIGNRNNR